MSKRLLRGKSKEFKEAYKLYMKRHDKKKKLDEYRYRVNPKKWMISKILSWLEGKG